MSFNFSIGSGNQSQMSCDDSSEQMSWFPDTIDRREIQQSLPLCQTTLIPSAPPAESNSSLSDSEATDIDGPSIPSKNTDRFRHIHGSKNKSFHRGKKNLQNIANIMAVNEGARSY